MAKASKQDDGKDRDRNRKLKWALNKSENVRDIGTPPPIKNKRRRAKAIKDPVFFLRTYFPDTFNLEFSADHLDVISTLERVSKQGGLFALAMPRGSGKTQISIRMALRAILLGRRRYVCIIGAAEPAARRIIKSLRTELTWNQKLYEDFPNELHGIPQLQGDNRKAGGQLCHGEKTAIEMGVAQIVFPTIPGSKSSGSIITSCGLTGNVRGQFHTLQSGETLRPDMVIPDDPQTKDSARSPSQNNERQEILEGDVLGLAGPDKAIACVMPCTVIACDDLADRMLRHKLWNGKRTKTLYEFPANMELWDEYFQVRDEGLRIHKSQDAGNLFYIEHREEMDRGARVGWEARVLEGDVSAIQTAMHLWHRSPAAFAAEYQNEPVDLAALEDKPRCRGLETKITKLKRGEVPLWATHITAGIDVQQRVLYYSVIAWADDFTGSVIDYGAWPQQRRSYFTLAEASPTLQSASGISEIEGSLWWGLEGLSQYLDKNWQREGKGTGALPLERALVDVGWGDYADLVYEWLRRTQRRAFMPAKGTGITAGKRPMDEWQRQPGQRHGLNWMLTSPSGPRQMRRVTHDTNWWKTFVATRCASPAGVPGSLSVFGSREEEHRLLMDHLGAEGCVRTSGNGRELWEWHQQPGQDNHLFDCIVEAAVAASIGNVSLDRLRETKPTKTRVKLSALKASKR